MLIGCLASSAFLYFPAVVCARTITCVILLTNKILTAAHVADAWFGRARVKVANKSRYRRHVVLWVSKSNQSQRGAPPASLTVRQVLATGDTARKAAAASAAARPIRRHGRDRGGHDKRGPERDCSGIRGRENAGRLKHPRPERARRVLHKALPRECNDSVSCPLADSYR